MLLLGVVGMTAWGRSHRFWLSAGTLSLHLSLVTDLDRGVWLCNVAGIVRHPDCHRGIEVRDTPWTMLMIAEAGEYGQTCFSIILVGNQSLTCTCWGGNIRLSLQAM